MYEFFGLGSNSDGLDVWINKDWKFVSIGLGFSKIRCTNFYDFYDFRIGLDRMTGTSNSRSLLEVKVLKAYPL